MHPQTYVLVCKLCINKMWPILPAAHLAKLKMNCIQNGDLTENFDVSRVRMSQFYDPFHQDQNDNRSVLMNNVMEIQLSANEFKSDQLKCQI